MATKYINGGCVSILFSSQFLQNGGIQLNGPDKSMPFYEIHCQQRTIPPRQRHGDLEGTSSCSPGCTSFTGAGIVTPVGIAPDAARNFWVANVNSATETPVGANSCSLGCVTFTGGGVVTPARIVVDAVENVWVTD